MRTNSSWIPGSAFGSPGMTLRGIMAIPTPTPEPAQRQRAFAQLRQLFEHLKRDHPAIDTLSMGMSDDYLLAIAEGATMVRVGSALFGARQPNQLKGETGADANGADLVE